MRRGASLGIPRWSRILRIASGSAIATRIVTRPWLSCRILGTEDSRKQAAPGHRDNFAKGWYRAGRKRKEIQWQSLASLTGLLSVSTSF